MLNARGSPVAALFVAVVIVFVPILGAQSQQGCLEGLLLGVHKSGEYREIWVEGGALRTLERYGFDSHDDYDFVVRVKETILIGRFEIRLAAKPGGARLVRDWPAGTPVQVRLKKKGIFKKRMEMELANPKGKKVPLLLVSVRDRDGRELCKRKRDAPDCTNVHVSP